MKAFKYSSGIESWMASIKKLRFFELVIGLDLVINFYFVIGLNLICGLDLVTKLELAIG